MNNFNMIYRILKYLEKAMEMLETEGYITGLSIKRSIDGEICCSISHPRITLKGLEYLQENSIMQKAASLAKGVADIIS